jgi:hypothetical protein
MADLVYFFGLVAVLAQITIIFCILFVIPRKVNKLQESIKVLEVNLRGIKRRIETLEKGDAQDTKSNDKESGV